jgi:hypothetical protein
MRETVRPANRDARWANAKCSESGGYDFQVSIPPSPDGSWVINFEGGGFCVFDGSGQGGCSNRDPQLVQAWSVADRSTSYEAPYTDPDFSNSTWVYTHYCSNDQYSGTNTTGVPMHFPGDTGPLVNFTFTGRLNVLAMMDILRERYGLNDASAKLAVYAIGHSAGGWGVTNNAYILKGYLPLTAGRGNLLLGTHSGFVPLAWGDPNYPVFGIPGNTMLTAFATLSSTWKSQVMPACQQANPQQPQLCLSASVLYDFITGPTTSAGLDLPLLVFQNRQDQLYMGLTEIPLLSAGINAQDKAARDEFLRQMNVAMGIDPGIPNQSSRVKWLMAASDPDLLRSDGTVEPNVHPPLEYETNPPDGPTNSLDSMTSRFWKARGQGVGRGRMPGEVHTYDCNWVPDHLCP